MSKDICAGHEFCTCAGLAMKHGANRDSVEQLERECRFKKMEESLWVPDSIRTFSGQYVNVFNPDPDTLILEDIAHALSNMPRFGGHLPEFFSVAQHSIMCSIAGGSHYGSMPLELLMHDASEAFLMDIPSPIKKKLTNYKEIEDNLMNVLAKKFGFQYPFEPMVKKIDEFQLEVEWYSLMLQDRTHDRYKQIRIMSPREAKNEFIKAYDYYTR